MGSIWFRKNGKLFTKLLPGRLSVMYRLFHNRVYLVSEAWKIIHKVGSKTVLMQLFYYGQKDSVCWVRRIHTMHLDPLTDLHGTPGAPKRARFGPEWPFWGPGGPWRAPRGQIWSRLPPIGPSGLDSWSPHTFTWYRAPSGPQGS